MADRAEIKKERQANLELLRLVLMYFSIVTHLLGEGKLLQVIGFGGVPYLILWFVSTLCHPADVCFVLISAYFLADRPFRASRLLRLWLMVLFYTLLGLLLGMTVFHMKITWEGLLKTFFPITSSTYWFMTQYTLLIMVSPLLNRLIGSLNRAAHARVIILLVLLFSVIPTVLFWAQDYFSDGWDLTWFVLVYFIGAYLRRYEFDIPRATLWYFGCCAALTLSRLLFGTLALRFTGSAHGAGILCTACSPFFLFMAVCLFCMFRRMKIGRAARSINRLATCAIGVYLLHTNYFLYPQLRTRANLSEAGGIGSILFRALWIALIVFSLGLGTEALRRQFTKLYREKAMCRWLDDKAKALSERFLRAEENG